MPQLESGCDVQRDGICRTLISSHERAAGSRFISGTVENVYSTSQMQEMTAKEETINQFGFFPPSSLADVLLPRRSIRNCSSGTISKAFALLEVLFGHT